MCALLWAWSEIVAAHHWVNHYAWCHLQADAYSLGSALSHKITILRNKYYAKSTSSQMDIHIIVSHAHPVPVNSISYTKTEFLFVGNSRILLTFVMETTSLSVMRRLKAMLICWNF